MAAQVKVSNRSKFNSKASKAQVGFTTSPLKSFGNVNIDNISDDEYEVIKEIATATINRQIQWKAQNFISIVTALMTKKPITLNYKARYNGLNITIRSDIKGKTSIKVTAGFTNKVLVDTFIPFKPVIRHGFRTGTARGMELYNLYKLARYQVDGELLAS